VVFGLSSVFSCGQVVKPMATVFPFCKSRFPNPICAALWERQLVFAIETLVVESLAGTSASYFLIVYIVEWNSTGALAQ
jgi:hypothetical protein